MKKSRCQEEVGIEKCASWATKQKLKKNLMRIIQNDGVQVATKMDKGCLPLVGFAHLTDQNSVCDT